MMAGGTERLVMIRGLLAMAESSEFAPEAAAFADKARHLASRYAVDPQLLRFPCEPLPVAVLVAELQRLRHELRRFDADDESWATKSAEWSASLDEYDAVLEAAAELLQFPIPRLPFGCRRHFRPDERAQIEVLVDRRLASPSRAESR